MSFYNELDSLVEKAKQNGAFTGRSVREGGGREPDNNKLKNYTYQLASTFANKFYALIGTDYKKLQDQETQITVAKSDLDNCAKEYCVAKETKKEEQNSLIKSIDDLKERKVDLLKKINADVQSKNDIETKYLKEETEGDLKQIPMWIFVVIMTIVGLAEMVIYQSVFLSQEIGIIAEMEENQIAHLEIMAFVMGIGFIVMITWLAHEAGKRIRHIEGTDSKNRPAQWLKVFLIIAIVMSAIFSTVKMRSDMHKSSELNAKLTTIVDAEEDDGDEAFLDAEDDTGSDDGLDTEDEDEELDDEADAKVATPVISEKEKLEKAIIAIKANGAWYFMAINFFIFMGGVMLAYHTHTSSVRYEQLLGLIEKQRKKLKELDEEHFKMLDHLKNDTESVAQIVKPWYKKLFSKKSDMKVRENNKLKITQERFMQALTKYITLVNEYDTLREEIHSKADATVSAYINAIRSYVDALSDYVEISFDTNLYSDVELESIIKKRTKLAKYLELRQENEQELVHINSIEEVISKVDCTNGDMQSYFEAFRAVEIPKKEEM